MIFSTTKQEIYYLLSCLLKSYDISILHDIMGWKNVLEDKDNLEWHILQGIHYNKLTLSSNGNPIINQILFNPYHEAYQVKPIHNSNIFQLKIALQTFSLKGFILNRINDRYSLSSLKDHISIINHIIKEDGPLEVHALLFQSHIFTDLVGNHCIRSIILIDDKSNYEYHTVAICDNKFIDPVERYPSMIN